MKNIAILGGRPGRLLPEIINQIKLRYQDNHTCLLIVPEQYTLQAEREIIKRLELPGFFNIEVLSPSRFIQKIFERAGNNKIIIDNRGKQIALSRALLKCQKELSYYQSAAQQTGFIQKMSEEIALIKQTHLTLSDFQEKIISMPEGALKEKCKDIALAWAQYDIQLNSRFVDGEDVYRSAGNKLAKSGIVNNAHIWVYGFDILTNSLCSLLGQCALLSQGLTVALTIDKETAPDGEIFASVRKSAAKFCNILESMHLPYQYYYLSNKPLQAAPAIAHLEQNLFSHNMQAYTNKPEGIYISGHLNPFAEVHHAAGQIIKLNRQGIPFEEIGVIINGIDEYASIIYALFNSYGIPYYAEEKMPAASHGLIKFLLGALKAATRGYQPSDILQCLKSGFAPINQRECHYLENYMLAYGIQGKRWLTPFKRGSDEERLIAEPLREKLIAPIENMHKALSASKDTTASLTAIYDLLKETGAYERLLKDEEALLSNHMEAEAVKNRQVWQFLLGTLDQMHDLMGGERIPMIHIAAWLEAGFDSGNISALPPTPGRVICGEIGHVMPGTLQALFTLNLNDGLFKREAKRLISDGERSIIDSMIHQETALSSDDMTTMARIDLLRTFALPTARLYLSYAKANQEGRVIRPAPILSLIKTKIFVDLIEEGMLTELPGPALPLSPEIALEGISVRLSLIAKGMPIDQALSNQWLDAFSRLLTHPEYGHRVTALLHQMAYTLHTPPLSQNISKKLFGTETLSISRLEEYAACPYKHFVTYGLRPVPRKEWRMDSRDIGTFFHEALKSYTQAVKGNQDWPNITQEASNSIMEMALSPLTQLWEEGPLSEDARTLAAGKRYIQTIKKAAWIFTKQAQSSEFYTSSAEITFGYEHSLLPPIFLEMPDGSRLMLRGIIDRIDKYECSDGTYIRVIDYKSGQRQLTPTAMWWGLQLQLLLYLYAAINQEKHINPAGAFYFRIDDPMTEMQEDIQEAAEAAIAKKLKLQGITLADINIFKIMDTGESPTTIDKIFGKEGQVLKTAKALSLPQLNQLLIKTQSTARELASAMHQGIIAIAPSLCEKRLACERCDYISICHWDAQLPGAIAQEYPTITMEEMRGMLEMEINQNQLH